MNWNKRIPRRLAVIDAYRFPAAARHRVATTYGTLTAADLDRVEAATRQWFRLAARHPRAKLTMPSLIAGALWQELARQTGEYATFCTDAFGRPFPAPAAVVLTGGSGAASGGPRTCRSADWTRRERKWAISHFFTHRPPT